MSNPQIDALVELIARNDYVSDYPSQIEELVSLANEANQIIHGKSLPPV